MSERTASVPGSPDASPVALGVLLDFASFAAVVQEHLDLPAMGAVRPESDLYGECGLDSLAAFRLLLLIEDLADPPTRPKDLPELFTMGDAHEHYRSLRR